MQTHAFAIPSFHGSSDLTITADFEAWNGQNVAAHLTASQVQEIHSAGACESADCCCGGSSWSPWPANVEHGGPAEACGPGVYILPVFGGMPDELSALTRPHLRAELAEMGLGADEVDSAMEA